MKIKNKKHTSKNKKRKVLKLKYNRIKQIISILSFLLLLFTFIFTSKTIYIKFKCRNLEYAVNYELSNDCGSNNLLRVQNSKLVFLDTDKVVINAQGLSKKEPHRTTIIEGHFTKDFFNSWDLENAYDISNN